MTNIRLLIYPVVFMFVLSFSFAAFGQAGRATFQVFDNEPEVIELSKIKKESESVFSDTDGDGIYDTLTMGDMELTCEIDEANAYGITYLDKKNVVYYPAFDSSIPKPGEYALNGFIHYFDPKGVSIYFAVVLNRLSDIEEEALRKTKKKLVPYRADFIDSNGLRVGIPTLILLSHSKLIYNADFQRFSKSTDTIMLAHNPEATNRELYIMRKIPDLKDSLLLIHYKWY